MNCDELYKWKEASTASDNWQGNWEAVEQLEVKQRLTYYLLKLSEDYYLQILPHFKLSIILNIIFDMYK